jgi:uncharacterized protein YkwD
MRVLAAVGAVSVFALCAVPDGLAQGRKPSRPHASGHVRVAVSPVERASVRLRRLVLSSRHASPQSSADSASSQRALEVDIVSRINAQRGARGLRPLRVSAGLSAAARYHCRQMGLLGFFEHESHNGAPFWRRIARFYTPRRNRYWSVGENLFWESPDTSGASAVHQWMRSAPHRENILTREFRDIGVAAVHFDSAPGAFGDRPVTIVTADFGRR